MRLVFERDAGLPRLAWCARLEQGSPRVRLRHGEGVETWPEGFVEGAWDGPYGDREPDRAGFVAGTGGRVRDDELVFVAPSDPSDRLHSVRCGDALLVSNSLHFALAAAGDALDPDYPYYADDFLAWYRLGFTTRRKWLRTRAGEVDLHELSNLRVNAALERAREERSVGPPPADFKAHVEGLRRCMQRVIRNASDPARRRPLRPLMMLSRGYDSPAMAVLGRDLGVDQGLTLVGRRAGDRDDNGRELGEALGYAMTEVDRRAYRSRDDVEIAEFLPTPEGSDVPLAAAAEPLAGTLQIVGFHGDVLWSTDPAKANDRRAWPGTPAASGQGNTEFRLRTGYAIFAPLYWDAPHCRAVHRISASAELLPWSVGGDYDRPIPRRIVEEAGISRESFGRSKIAGVSVRLRRRRNLGRARADFAAWLRERPWRGRSGPRHRLLYTLSRLERRWNRGVAGLARRLGVKVEMRPLVPPRYRRRRVGPGYWYAFADQRIAPRYAARSDG